MRGVLSLHRGRQHTKRQGLPARLNPAPQGELAQRKILGRAEHGLNPTRKGKTGRPEPEKGFRLDDEK